MTGCNNEAIIEEQQNKIEQLNNQILKYEDNIKEQQQIIDNHNKEFSYLNDFSKIELDAYKSFAEGKDTKHLLGFSLERVLLIYFHSVVIDDVEAIYSLTFNDGTIADLATFRHMYYTEGLHKKEVETVLDFRYYNTIKVREDNKSENEVAVEVSLNFGLYQSTEILGLKKEDGIWKMDILHLLE